MLFIAAIACALAWLAPAGSALAFSETVSGGTTTLSLALPKKITATATSPATADGSSIVFQNTGGVMDAARGTARLDLAGGLQLKAKKGGRADITSLKLNVGPSGIINAKVKGEQMAFATTEGASLQPGSLEARLNGASALITDDAAKKLNRALGKVRKKKGKGKTAAAASKKKKKVKKIFKEGDSIGTVSTVANVSTVPVAAQGDAQLVPEVSSAFTFIGKGVNALPGFGGINPVSPARSAGPDFEFPITGGRIAPDFSIGQLATAGGLRITKNMSNGGACDAQKPLGTFIQQTNLTLDFTRKSLLSTIDSSGGFIGNDVITADLDYSGATMSVSPGGAITIEDLGVVITHASATTLNGLFGTQAQGCGEDFQAGDSLGHLNVSGQVG
jgi:hypothetical protein